MSVNGPSNLSTTYAILATSFVRAKRGDKEAAATYNTIKERLSDKQFSDFKSIFFPAWMNIQKRKAEVLKMEKNVVGYDIELEKINQQLHTLELQSKQLEKDAAHELAAELNGSSIRLK